MKKTLPQCIAHFIWIPVLLLSALAMGQTTNDASSGMGTGTTELPTAPIHSLTKGPVEILSDTGGVDFGPYLKGVVAAVRRNWYDVIPEDAMPPLLTHGKVVVEFVILQNGQIAGVRYISQSGNVALDRAAYGGITASNPFQPLPAEFKGSHLSLRFTFLYNPTATENESVRVSEILVPVSISKIGSADDHEATAARLQAENLLAQIRSGKSFEDLAGKNPDVGYFRRGQLGPSIENVVFAMKVGDVSDVIPTKQGFVILKVTDHKDQKNKPGTNNLQTSSDKASE